MSGVIRKLRKLLAHFIRQRLEINATSIRERGRRGTICPNSEEGRALCQGRGWGSEIYINMSCVRPAHYISRVTYDISTGTLILIRSAPAAMVFLAAILPSRSLDVARQRQADTQGEEGKFNEWTVGKLRVSE